jgi:hypothetical protein
LGANRVQEELINPFSEEKDMATQDMRSVLSQLANDQRYTTKKAYAQQCVARWRRTNLLEGLSRDPQKEEQIAMILENQLRHTLNESNSISTGGNSRIDAGNIQGYTAVAFPMVRKIFGNTIANNIASIQTMNTPTGLIFYLDFTYTRDVGGDTDRDGQKPSADYDVATYAGGNSLYGQPTAEGVRRGATRVGGQYDLAGSGYSRWHEPAQIPNEAIVFAGAFDDATRTWTIGESATTEGRNAEALQYDPQILQLLEDDVPFFFMVVKNVGGFLEKYDLENIREVSLFHGVNEYEGARYVSGALVIQPDLIQGSKGIVNVRRLNQVVRLNVADDATAGWTVSPFSTPDDPNTALLFVVHGDPAAGLDDFKSSDDYAAGAEPSKLGLSAVLRSRFITSGSTEELKRFRSGATNLVPVGESDLAVDPRPLISEITLKLGTEPVTVEKRAYRVKWTDDLATDVKAQLALDVAEVLSNTMSDAIQLDIDRELLGIMLDQASAAKLYWSKQVGKYINQRTGRRVQYDFSDDAAIPSVATATTTRDDWYSGLTEVVITAANEIHTRTLRGQANFIVVSPDVASILESSRKFVPTFGMDANGQVDMGSYQIGAQEVGTIAGRFKVYRCVDFPRNKILVGYKGQDDIDAGFVYCPYVPLVITPQLANTEDFQPRQAVFTRYAKKMVRADYFATVTVLDMDIV